MHIIYTREGRKVRGTGQIVICIVKPKLLLN